ncbi:MAG: ATP-dependent zinc metalloprotease FtsH [Candidatus Daviesbacteria bacterium]|nr:ATP-dependent zinc metalloprotease FtsH [Candidatus Daviesbacteria bacterium]
MAQGTKKKLTPNKIIETLKSVGTYALIGLVALFFFVNLSGDPTPQDEIPLSQLINEIKQEKIAKVIVDGEKLLISYKEEDKKAVSRKEAAESIFQILKSSDVDPKSVTIEVKDNSLTQALYGVLGSILPLLLLAGLMFFVLRHAKDAGQGIFSFGQSRAKIFTKDAPQIKFADVAGVEEAKKELSEIVEFLKTPEKFTALGARTPKGVLLVGPAGTGKTLLSRAVAGEAGVPFFSIAGSEFMEMLVGVGAARVRDMFGTAKKSAPSIIFIDEIESIGRARGMGGMGGGHDEREQTLNQILVEMDGFAPNDHVIVIGATNRPDMLDAALVRPGRFDRRVTLGLPDLNERKAIISIHMKGKPITPDVDLEKLARRTVGFSGADIANMLNEAAILAAREDKKAIDPKDFEEAATKVKMGPQRKRMSTDEDRKLAAYHEAGHAVVGHFLKNVDPLHRVTIVARAESGGHTQFTPLQDRSNESKSRLMDQITMALGAQAAEKMFLDDISTGAAADLSVATRIARAMVTEYGMSDLGPIAVGPRSIFGSWMRMGEGEDQVSEQLQSKIDLEIKKILDLGYKKASEILKIHKKELQAVTKALLETETLESEEFEKIVGKKK